MIETATGQRVEVGTMVAFTRESGTDWAPPICQAAMPLRADGDNLLTKGSAGLL